MAVENYPALSDKKPPLGCVVEPCEKSKMHPAYDGY